MKSSGRKCGEPGPIRCLSSPRSWWGRQYPHWARTVMRSVESMGAGVGGRVARKKRSLKGSKSINKLREGAKERVRVDPENSSKARQQRPNPEARVVGAPLQRPHRQFGCPSGPSRQNRGETSQMHPTAARPVSDQEMEALPPFQPVPLHWLLNSCHLSGCLFWWLQLKWIPERWVFSQSRASLST